MRHEVRFTREKLDWFLTVIQSRVHRETVPLPPFRLAILDGPGQEPPVAPDIDDTAWPVVEPGSVWTGRDSDFVLRTTFTVPQGTGKGMPVALHLPIGASGDFSHPEALVHIDGVPWAACDRHHQEVMLPASVMDGRPHSLALHGWTGVRDDIIDMPGMAPVVMGDCSVAVIDTPTREFIATARVALDAVANLDDDTPVRVRLLNTLDDAFRALDMREPLDGRFYGSVPGAHTILRDGIGRAGEPLDVTIAATGHSHIDVAWLWTLGQTRRKAGRTFHTVLRLMEQYPEYHFTQSQPQLYKYIMNDYPALFESVKEKVREGRWEPVGGMWVEADCNISGPESLARQFLLGRSFFREHFGPGVESPVLFLPDVFGYAWNLPQLIREAGLEYFFTIKISWNQYNRMPYDTFWWQGLDGTKVLTHFSTSIQLEDNPTGYMTTYNSRATAEQALGSWRMFQQKDVGQELFMAYGWGDGGGGPTREMIENIREMASFPSLPRMRQKGVGDFFRDLERDHGGELPVWNGELYLEIHRGTYTTQAAGKRANRKSEFMLHDAEFLATMASVLDGSHSYPADRFREAWELVCLNQFHDIIPGSSITPVYTESREQYGRVRDMALAARDGALATIASKVRGDVLLVNPTSFPRREPVEIPATVTGARSFTTAEGGSAPVQVTGGSILVDAGGMPPYSVTPLFAADSPAPAVADAVTTGGRSIENALIRLELDDNGDICRILDKRRGREVMPDGAKANLFQAFDDRPRIWDAWDVEPYFEDTMYLSDPAESIRAVEEGPLRGVIEVRRRILGSPYTQRISLTASSPRIDIDTTIDWRERRTLLKVAFPIDVLSPEATCEIQWGNVGRPTHRNTSWDWGKFEVCAQKWVDLSEGDYGVSILNDCKYGHDIRDNVIRISLLRGTMSPDPEADRGVHRFAYAILPHEGGWGSETIAEAYAFNDPVIAVAGRGGADAPPEPFVTVDNPNVVIETVKRAEDGEGFIVRMYESRRSRGTVQLRTMIPLNGAFRTNIIEENLRPLEVDGRTVTTTVRPYEILTLRLLPAR